jgi:hypothetical protein
VTCRIESRFLFRSCLTFYYNLFKNVVNALKNRASNIRTNWKGWGRRSRVFRNVETWSSDSVESPKERILVQGNSSGLYLVPIPNLSGGIEDIKKFIQDTHFGLTLEPGTHDVVYLTLTWWLLSSLKRWYAHKFIYVFNSHAASIFGGEVEGNFRGKLSYLAPLGSEKISAPYFKQCFFRGGFQCTTLSKHVFPLRRRNYCSGLRWYDAREKGIVIWPCWCFHGRYYFYSLKFTLVFINERKRKAYSYLISNFDSLETAPSNLLP